MSAGDTWARAAFKTTEISGTALAVPQAIWTAWCSERNTFTGTQPRRPSTAPVRSTRRGLWVRCQWLSRFVNLRARRGAPWILMVALLSASSSLLQSTSDHGHQPKSRIARGEFRHRQTRQLPRAVDLKGRLLSCQSYYLLPPHSIHLQSDIQWM